MLLRPQYNEICAAPLASRTTFTYMALCTTPEYIFPKDSFVVIKELRLNFELLVDSDNELFCYDPPLGASNYKYGPQVAELKRKQALEAEREQDRNLQAEQPQIVQSQAVQADTLQPQTLQLPHRSEPQTSDAEFKSPAPPPTAPPLPPAPSFGPLPPAPRYYVDMDIETLLEEGAREAAGERHRSEPKVKNEDTSYDGVIGTKNEPRQDVIDRRRRNSQKEDLMSHHGSRRPSNESAGESHRRRAPPYSDEGRLSGDRMRSGRLRERSRSPDDDRYYRPNKSRGSYRPDSREGRYDDRFNDRSSWRPSSPTFRGRNHDNAYRDRRNSNSGRPYGSYARDDRYDRRTRDYPPRGRDRDGQYRERDARPRRRSRSPDANPPNPESDDKNSVFVQQLAARLRTSELREFFTAAGTVKEATIVKDRVSHRSKGIGYVEFYNEESVTNAIQLTGQKLCGIPVIVQHTEAEKNRQASKTSGNGNANSIPHHRLYVGNVHFSITEDDLKEVFSPYGDLAFVAIQKEEGGRSRGYGFVEFADPADAKQAMEELNGFTVAGRNLRVGLGSDKFQADSNQTMLQKFGQPAGAEQYQGSSFSGAGGRGGNALDRAGGGNTEKSRGASSLDDSDLGGVNFNNVDRESLMRKLLRTEDHIDEKTKLARARAAATKPMETLTASRCLLMKGMFNPAAEEGPNWVKELEDEIRDECTDKYGKVVHISVDANSTEGEVYIAFAGLSGGDKALKGLNGRFFGGQQITATPIVEAVYKTSFPKAF